MEYFIVGVAVAGLAIGVFDGLNRGLLIVLGGLVVLAYPFVEAQVLSGALPWTVAFDGKPQWALVDGALWIFAAFLVPYLVVRILFALTRKGGIA